MGALIASGFIDFAMSSATKPRESLRYSRARIGLPPNIASSCTQALRLSLMNGCELDVELLAVVEQRLVMAGNACRAAVEVEVRVLVELADLRITGFVDAIAVAHRHVAAAGAERGLEHLHFVTLARQLVSRGESRDAAAENQHLAGFRSASRVGAVRHARWRAAVPGATAARIHRGGSADRACQLKEVAARHRSIHVLSPCDSRQSAWRARLLAINFSSGGRMLSLSLCIFKLCANDDPRNQRVAARIFASGRARAAPRRVRVPRLAASAKGAVAQRLVM